MRKLALVRKLSERYEMCLHDVMEPARSTMGLEGSSVGADAIGVDPRPGHSQLLVSLQSNGVAVFDMGRMVSDHLVDAAAGMASMVRYAHFRGRSSNK